MDLVRCGRDPPQPLMHPVKISEFITSKSTTSTAYVTRNIFQAFKKLIGLNRLSAFFFLFMLCELFKSIK